MSFVFEKRILCRKDYKAFQRYEQYKEYYKVKYNLCKEQNPNLIAEIGVRAGYSAWTFLQACPHAKFIGYDANNGTHGGQGGQDGRYAQWAVKILKQYNVELIELDTQTTYDLKIRDVDFFHVDGDHSTQGVIHDLDLAFKAISDTGLIVVDDITYLDTVREGVNIWLKKMEGIVTSEFVDSLRGEMLIRKIL